MWKKLWSNWPIFVLILFLALIVGVSYVISGLSFRMLFLWPNGVATLAVVMTLIFIAWQAFLTREAIGSSEKSSQAELRAYLVVTLNTGSFQDREKDIKFEGNPSLKNAGKTPAHNVRYWTNSAVLSDEAVQTYSFPPGDLKVSGYVMGVDQPFMISIIHSDFCDSLDVETIKLGKGKAFFYWGFIEYEDIFGKSQTTEFCHRLYFYKNHNSDTWQVNGHYVPGRNKST